MLANLFTHYAFDLFLAREFPTVEFERYADDAVVHCASERRAQQVWSALTARTADVGLRLHPDKTRIVYCGMEKRLRRTPGTSFTFSGTRSALARPRARTAGVLCRSYPRSAQALKAMGQQVRRWGTHRRIGLDLD